MHLLELAPNDEDASVSDGAVQMASDIQVSCESDPNFAIICAFMQKFGTLCGITALSIVELKSMLENTQEVPEALVNLLIRLLRKTRKSVSNEKWERAIVKFCHTYNNQDAWEVERFGYMNAKLPVKIRVLKELLELQFDLNPKFKTEVNKMSATELRSQPLGKDNLGRLYWFQCDNNCELRVYKDDPDDETWCVVARDRGDLAKLIGELSNGEINIKINSLCEDDNSNDIDEMTGNATTQNNLSELQDVSVSEKIESCSRNDSEVIDGDDAVVDKPCAECKAPALSDLGKSDAALESTSEIAVCGKSSVVKEKIITSVVDQEFASNVHAGQKRNSDTLSETECMKSNDILSIENGDHPPNKIPKGPGSESTYETNNELSEAIEEPVLYVTGEGSGKDCETGNEIPRDQSNDEYKNQHQNATNSGVDYCESAKSNMLVTHKVYQLGTIYDTKNDTASILLHEQNKSKLKASRWDVSTAKSIIADQSSSIEQDTSDTVNDCMTAIDVQDIPLPPQPSMFYFGPRCRSFQPDSLISSRKNDSENMEVVDPVNEAGTVANINVCTIATSNKHETATGQNICEAVIRSTDLTQIKTVKSERQAHIQKDSDPELPSSNAETTNKSIASSITKTHTDSMTIEFSSIPSCLNPSNLSHEDTPSLHCVSNAVALTKCIEPLSDEHRPHSAGTHLCMEESSISVEEKFDRQKADCTKLNEPLELNEDQCLSPQTIIESSKPNTILPDPVGGNEHCTPYMLTHDVISRATGAHIAIVDEIVTEANCLNQNEYFIEKIDTLDLTSKSNDVPCDLASDADFALNSNEKGDEPSESPVSESKSTDITNFTSESNESEIIKLTYSDCKSEDTLISDDVDAPVTRIDENAQFGSDEHSQLHADVTFASVSMDSTELSLKSPDDLAAHVDHSTDESTDDVTDELPSPSSSPRPFDNDTVPSPTTEIHQRHTPMHEKQEPSNFDGADTTARLLVLEDQCESTDNSEGCNDLCSDVATIASDSIVSNRINSLSDDMGTESEEGTGFSEPTDLSNSLNQSASMAIDDKYNCNLVLDNIKNSDQVNDINASDDRDSTYSSQKEVCAGEENTLTTYELLSDNVSANFPVSSDTITSDVEMGANECIDNVHAKPLTGESYDQNAIIIHDDEKYDQFIEIDTANESCDEEIEETSESFQRVFITKVPSPAATKIHHDVSDKQILETSFLDDSSSLHVAEEVPVQSLGNNSQTSECDLTTNETLTMAETLEMNLPDNSRAVLSDYKNDELIEAALSCSHIIRPATYLQKAGTLAQVEENVNVAQCNDSHPQGEDLSSNLDNKALLSSTSKEQTISLMPDNIDLVHTSLSDTNRNIDSSKVDSPLPTDVTSANVTEHTAIYPQIEDDNYADFDTAVQCGSSATAYGNVSSKQNLSLTVVTSSAHVVESIDARHQVYNDVSIDDVDDKVSPDTTTDEVKDSEVSACENVIVSETSDKIHQEGSCSPCGNTNANLAEQIGIIPQVEEIVSMNADRNNSSDIILKETKYCDMQEASGSNHRSLSEHHVDTTYKRNCLSSDVLTNTKYMQSINNNEEEECTSPGLDNKSSSHKTIFNETIDFNVTTSGGSEISTLPTACEGINLELSSPSTDVTTLASSLESTAAPVQVKDVCSDLDVDTLPTIRTDNTSSTLACDDISSESNSSPTNATTNTDTLKRFDAHHQVDENLSVDLDCNNISSLTTIKDVHDSILPNAIDSKYTSSLTPYVSINPELSSSLAGVAINPSLTKFSDIPIQIDEDAPVNLAHTGTSDTTILKEARDSDLQKAIRSETTSLSAYYDDIRYEVGSSSSDVTNIKNSVLTDIHPSDTCSIREKNINESSDYDTSETIFSEKIFLPTAGDNLCSKPKSLTTDVTTNAIIVEHVNIHRQTNHASVYLDNNITNTTVKGLKGTEMSEVFCSETKSVPVPDQDIYSDSSSSLTDVTTNTMNVERLDVQPQVEDVSGDLDSNETLDKITLNKANKSEMSESSPTDVITTIQGAVLTSIHSPVEEDVSARLDSNVTSDTSTNMNTNDPDILEVIGCKNSLLTASVDKISESVSLTNDETSKAIAAEHIYIDPQVKDVLTDLDSNDISDTISRKVKVSHLPEAITSREATLSIADDDLSPEIKISPSDATANTIVADYIDTDSQTKDASIELDSNITSDTIILKKVSNVEMPEVNTHPKTDDVSVNLDSNTNSDTFSKTIKDPKMPEVGSGESGSLLAIHCDTTLNKVKDSDMLECSSSEDVTLLATEGDIKLKPKSSIDVAKTPVEEFSDMHSQVKDVCVKEITLKEKTKDVARKGTNDNVHDDFQPAPSCPTAAIAASKIPCTSEVANVDCNSFGDAANSELLAIDDIRSHSPHESNLEVEIVNKRDEDDESTKSVQQVCIQQEDPEMCILNQVNDIRGNIDDTQNQNDRGLVEGEISTPFDQHTKLGNVSDEKVVTSTDDNFPSQLISEKPCVKKSAYVVGEKEDTPPSSVSTELSDGVNSHSEIQAADVNGAANVSESTEASNNECTDKRTASAVIDLTDRSCKKNQTISSEVIMVENLTPKDKDTIVVSDSEDGQETLNDSVLEITDSTQDSDGDKETYDDSFMDIEDSPELEREPSAPDYAIINVSDTECSVTGIEYKEPSTRESHTDLDEVTSSSAFDKVEYIGLPPDECNNLTDNDRNTNDPLSDSLIVDLDSQNINKTTIDNHNLPGDVDVSASQNKKKLTGTIRVKGASDLYTPKTSDRCFNNLSKKSNLGQKLTCKTYGKSNENDEPVVTVGRVTRRSKNLENHDAKPTESTKTHTKLNTKEISDKIDASKKSKLESSSRQDINVDNKGTKVQHQGVHATDIIPRRTRSDRLGKMTTQAEIIPVDNRKYNSIKEKPVSMPAAKPKAEPSSSRMPHKPSITSNAPLCKKFRGKNENSANIENKQSTQKAATQLTDNNIPKSTKDFDDSFSKGLDGPVLARKTRSQKFTQSATDVEILPKGEATKKTHQEETKAPSSVNKMHTRKSTSTDASTKSVNSNCIDVDEENKQGTGKVMLNSSTGKSNKLPAQKATQSDSSVRTRPEKSTESNNNAAMIMQQSPTPENLRQDKVMDAGKGKRFNEISFISNSAEINNKIKLDNPADSMSNLLDNTKITPKKTLLQSNMLLGISLNRRSARNHMTPFTNNIRPAHMKNGNHGDLDTDKNIPKEKNVKDATPPLSGKTATIVNALISENTSRTTRNKKSERIGIETTKSVPKTQIEKSTTFPIVLIKTSDQIPKMDTNDKKTDEQHSQNMKTVVEDKKKTVSSDVATNPSQLCDSVLNQPSAVPKLKKGAAKYRELTPAMKCLRNRMVSNTLSAATQLDLENRNSIQIADKTSTGKFESTAPDRRVEIIELDDESEDSSKCSKNDDICISKPPVRKSSRLSGGSGIDIIKSDRSNVPKDLNKSATLHLLDEASKPHLHEEVLVIPDSPVKVARPIGRPRKYPKFNNGSLFETQPYKKVANEVTTPTVVNDSTSKQTNASVIALEEPVEIIDLDSNDDDTNNTVSVTECYMPATDEHSELSDTIDLNDKDPLASDSVNEDVRSNTKDKTPSKPFTLSSFSMDFCETEIVPKTRRGLKKSLEPFPASIVIEVDDKEKTPKKRGRPRKLTQIRKHVEERREIELLASSDDEARQTPPSVKSKDPKATDNMQPTTKVRTKRRATSPNRRLMLSLGIDPIEQKAIQDQIEGGIVRQSRRIAQLKIREEAERRKTDDETTSIETQKQKKRKTKKSDDKEYKVEKKRPIEKPVEVIVPNELTIADDRKHKKKGRRKRKKECDPRKLFDEANPWKSSSSNYSTSNEDAADEDEEYSEEEEPVLQFRSDHEFSPESDLEDQVTPQPLKRARTVKKEDVEDTVDDCPCQKCFKSDHPEWILLCDSCDNGWHCSCLRPPLLVIPEGDWYCPPCQHKQLVECLQQKLSDVDKLIHKRDLEKRREERLAYIGISLNNVLPLSSKHKKGSENDTKANDASKRESSFLHDSENSNAALGNDADRGSRSESGSSADDSVSSDEPIYQLRERRQAHSYRFNDYDDLINSAIQDEMDAVRAVANQSRGKDNCTSLQTETAVKEAIEPPTINSQDQVVSTHAIDDKTEEKDGPSEAAGVSVSNDVSAQKPETADHGDDDEDDDDIIKPVLNRNKLLQKKKSRKLNNLDISSGDDNGDSDEDFKGTSSESDDDADADDFDSDESSIVGGGRRRGKNSNFEGVRRSTRARVSRYDADFIDDMDSDDYDDRKKRKKRLRSWDEETESEESDRSWGKRKRKSKAKRARFSAEQLGSSGRQSNKKKRRRAIHSDDSDEECYKEKKPKIKYGLIDDAMGPRTRGKKINYLDTLGSDSDDNIGSKRTFAKPIESEEEYVAPADEDDDEDEEDSLPAIEGPDESQNSQKTIEEEHQAVDESNAPSILDDLNPIEEINRNLEQMGENEMEKMMEEEDYANKQLQLVAQQLEKERKRKEREAQAKLEVQQLEQVIPPAIVATTPVVEPLLPPITVQISDQHPTTVATKESPMLEPLIDEVKLPDQNIPVSVSNDELSEPPSMSFDLFEMAGPKVPAPTVPPATVAPLSVSTPAVEVKKTPARKRNPPGTGRPRGRTKKSLEETVAHLGGMNKNYKSTSAVPSVSSSPSYMPPANNMEIAAPPQPFTQTQPAPSVITRMLQGPLRSPQSSPSPPSLPNAGTSPNKMYSHPMNVPGMQSIPSAHPQQQQAPPPPAYMQSRVHSPILPHHALMYRGNPRLPPDAPSHSIGVGGAVLDAAATPTVSHRVAATPPPPSLSPYTTHGQGPPTPSASSPVPHTQPAHLHSNVPLRTAQSGAMTPHSGSMQHQPPPTQHAPHHLSAAPPPHPPAYMHSATSYHHPHHGSPYGPYEPSGAHHRVHTSVFMGDVPEAYAVPIPPATTATNDGPHAIAHKVVSSNDTLEQEDDESCGTEGEFGGLVSYFSSQHEDDDLNS